MTAPVPTFTNDDEAAQHWLKLLRDGSDEQKIHAREQLAAIFERRGMFEEAADLLQSNYMAGSRTLPLFRSLMRIYVKREDEDAVRWAMQQAFETVRPALRPPAIVGPLRSGACDECGVALGLRDKLSGRSTCRGCLQWREDDWAARCDAYGDYLRTVVGRDDKQYGLSFELSQLQAFLGISADAARDIHWQAFRAYVDRALADDRLTEEEEESLFHLMGSLGFDETALEHIEDWPFRYLVARANAGRLTELDDCQLIVKPGEIAYLELLVSLMKERVIKEWQSGSAGFSFRIAKGVRFSTGQTRGRSVVVGTYMALEDQGQLTVTSRRVVFAGSKRSFEYPYSKLMSLEVFSNAIRIHVSNRTTTQLFTGSEGTGNLFAATINAAMQLGEP